MLGLHHLHLPAVAAHCGVRRGHALQCLQGLVGAPFLPEPDRGIEHDDQHDDQRVGQVSDQPGQNRGRQEHQDHEIAKLVEHRFQAGARRRLRQAIQAVALLANRHFLARQTGVESYAQVARHFSDVKRVWFYLNARPPFPRQGGRRVGRTCGLRLPLVH